MRAGSRGSAQAARPRLFGFRKDIASRTGPRRAFRVRSACTAARIDSVSFQLFGLPVSRGIAIGRAVLVASSRLDVAHYYVASEDVEAEVDRLRSARNAVARELNTLKRELPPEAPPELAALLDVHLMVLNDDALTGVSKHWIRDRHYNAEWALSAQLEVLARQFDEMEDEYLRERKADLEQVVERLLSVLARGADSASPLESHAVTPGAERRGPARARRERHLARGHASVQGRRLPRFRHRCGRQDLAHRDRRAQHGHPGGRRRARGEQADPAGRLGHHRRRRRRRDRRSVRHRSSRNTAHSGASATKAARAWRACGTCPR